MVKNNSLGKRLLALALSVIIVLGMLPSNVVALETAEAKIGDTTYATLADALAAVPKGTNQAAPAEVTTITLLRDAEYAFDVGTSDGSVTMNLKLDLGGKTLTLSPSVGSVGTKSNGIRVLAYSKLEIANGKIVCSSETADNVKVGIANYSELTLDDVQLEGGALTQYTINNRGALTLKGKTVVTGGDICSITNDPYDLYYITNKDASLTCDSSEVIVDSVLVERYERNSANKGAVELNISAGTFGKIVEDTATSVPVNYNVTGGTIGVSTTEELALALSMVKAGAEYACPEKPVTIKLLNNIDGSFNVGTSNGKAPKNLLLDLNNKTLTLKPGIGSDGTEVNGIRVLAYSKLEIINGTIVCSGDEADKVKVGIANYSDLTLAGVTVQAGAQTLYTINNRGALTLKGKTIVTSADKSICAITNDPYNLYYTTDKDASLTCDSSEVVVDSILVERYARNSANQGGVKLNISAGSFGSIEEDGESSVAAAYNITGGSFGSELGEDFIDQDKYQVVEVKEGEYVLKLKQGSFAFAQDAYTVTFGEKGNKFAATIELNSDKGTVTYSILENNDRVAEIDPATGDLTILKAGTVTVEAKTDGNDTYAGASAQYVLTVKPAYADVTSFSGGEVEGSKSENTVLTIKDVVLEWVEKDESIGRGQDGWWVGAKVNWPEGIDINNVKLQLKSVNAETGEDEWKSIDFEKDNLGYTAIWRLVTAEKLAECTAAGNNLDCVLQFSWDGDNVYEQTVTITIVPAGVELKQSGFAFAITGDTATYGQPYTVAVPSGGQAGTTPTFEVKAEDGVSNTDIAEFDENGKLVINKAGTVKVIATLSGDYYQDAVASYTLVINKADQTDFGFVDNSPVCVTWQEEVWTAPAVTGGKGNGELTWSIKGDSDVAQIVDAELGTIKLLKAGKFTLQVQKAGQEDYYNASAVAEIEIEVKLKPQEGFAFNAEDATVTFNGKDSVTGNKNEYTLVADGGQSTSGVIYKVTSGDAAVIEDETKGLVTIQKAGTVVITATKLADAQYAEISDTFTLTVERDDQEYTLPKTGTVPVTYGASSYVNALAEGEHISATYKPVYTITSDEIGAKINSSTGEITFNYSKAKVGKVAVSVTVAEDEQYNRFTETYEIEVSYLETDDKPIVENIDKWHTSTVYIKAPDGYTVAYDNKITAEFKQEIPYTENGIKNATVYLKDAKGYITKEIIVENIMLDTQAPSAVEIAYNEPDVDVKLEKALEILSFGIYKADTNKLSVTISAEDETSGIAKLIYTDDQGEHEVLFSGDALAEYTFDINAQYRDKITLKAVDVAGNESELSETGEYLVLDTIDPELTKEYVFATGEYQEPGDGIIYTQGDIAVKFTIDESNFDLSNKPVVKVNTEERELVWEPVENSNQWQATLHLSGEGDYVVKLNFTDASCNKKIEDVQEFRIDNTDPEITITDKAVDAPFGGEISKTDKTAVITIKEHNFKSDEVEVEVTATNILGQTVTVMDYKTYAKETAWTSVGNDTYTLELDLTVDAVYDINVTYTDLAGNSAAAEDKVTVDKEAPTNCQITYETPVHQLILDKILFFYQAQTIVKVTAEDITSGVDSIVLTYTKTDGSSAINKATEEKPLTVSQDGKVFSATYTLEAQADGAFSAVITDKAGNPTTVTDGTNRIVADSQDPAITVTYGAQADDTKVSFRTDANQKTDKFENAAVAYYDGAAYAQIEIDEANFYEGVQDKNGKIVHEVMVKVTKTDDNGNVTVTEYLPADAAQLVAGATAKDVTWTSAEDKHTAVIPFEGNGDYVLEIEYTDFSTNEAEISGADGNAATKSYESKIITVDESDPEITITDKAVDAPFGGEISKTDKTAVITIKEHNFKSDEVEVEVTATNILGQTVTVMDYKTYAKETAWTSVGNDTYTLELDLTVDAVYDINVTYTDLAGNSAAAEDKVTVDKEAPTNCQITYETPVHQLILDKILFFYQAQTIVKVTAEDITSGVDSIVLTYTKTDGSSAINKATEEKPLTVSQDGKVFSATYTLEAQADGAFSAVITDKAGNPTTVTDGTNRIVVDSKEPGIEVKYETSATGTTVFRDADKQPVNSFAEATQVYYNADAQATITIDEANFFEGVADANGKTVHEVMIKVTKTDDNGNVTVTEYLPENANPLVTGNVTLSRIAWSTEGDKHTIVVPFVGNGDYVLEIAYADFSTNDAAINGTDGNTGTKTYTSKIITVDEADPVIEILNPQAGAILKANHTAQIKITDHNFDPKDVEVVVTAKNILGKMVSVMDYTTEAKKATWTPGEDNTHTLNIPFNVDAVYEIKVNYTDLAGRKAEEKSDTFTVDKVAADPVKITYETPVHQLILNKITFGFYQAKTLVTVTTEDITSGVASIDLTYTKDEDASAINKAEEAASLTVVQNKQKLNEFTATYTIEANTRGKFGVKVVDKAGNVSTFDDKANTIITDTVNSKIQVEYTGLTYKDGFRDVNNNVVGAADAVKFHYSNAVEAKITINEANFFEGVKDDSGKVVHEVLIKVTKTDDDGKVTVTEYLPKDAKQLVSGAAAQTIQWTSNGDTHTTSITLADDGDYVLELSYRDFSGNDAAITGTDGNSGDVDYKSRILTVDKTKPVINVSYDNNSALNENCYKDNRTAIITVTEHNFKAEEFVLDVKTKNLMGDITVSDYAAFAKDPANWTHDGNVHTLKVLFAQDATYTFDVSYTDMAGNAADDYAVESFVVDHTAASNIKITYSTPILSKLVETLTFGFYKAEVVVTVTAEDLTAGVDYFELTYTRDKNATDAHTADFMQKLVAKPGSDAKTFTASYTVPAQARGSYSVKVFDRAGNASQTNDPENVIVTDTVSPEIKVDFAAKDANTKVHFVNSQVKDVETFNEAANAFFDGDVITTITVNEANFFEGKKTSDNAIIHELIIKVTKTDDNGDITVTEYLPVGAKQLVPGAAAKTIQWSTEGDTHTASITFADDGDYVLEITYSDFSENDSQLAGNDGKTGTKTYTSKVITVDETAPVIDVTYGNTEVINAIDGREYFDKTQSAVVTVIEHNFRAEDIAAVVTASNVIGEDVAVADFAAQLANAKNWKHDGNVHTAEVKYTVDANYTFDIDFVDLSQNPSADYAQDLFTVDTTAPKNLKVSYSTSILEQIKESITFGYYNAMMTVTITAEDETSGIYHFAYSYIKGKDVSGINAELLDEAIREAEITYDGKQATATFTIPKMVLGDDNQFNGTVEFTAYDRSEVNTLLQDSKVIVVDNIAPTATITYNAAVQKLDGVSYYDGDINATIVINEANFDSQDVVVSVTEKEKNYPINVSWIDNSVDVHTGTFTLSEDGDYVVSVQYQDKSGNKMESYTSNQMTIDTVDPEIKVSEVKHESANNGETIGFVVSVTDRNIELENFKPVLTVLKKTADSKDSFETVTIELGKAAVEKPGKNENGNTVYTYTVEDLEFDGYYSFVCEATDNANHTVSTIKTVDNAGEDTSVDTVNFSVNREGSVFWITTEHTQGEETIVDQLSGKYVNGEITVRVYEVNVDKVDEDKATIFTLNDGSAAQTVELNESNYKKNVSIGTGGWYKTEYTLDNSYFEKDGVYSLNIITYDKAENSNVNTQSEQGTVTFTVDRTKPVISANLTSKQVIDDTQYKVYFQITELNLDTATIVVKYNGKPIALADTDNAEETDVLVDMGNNEYSFTVKEGMGQSVEITAVDLAGNESDLYEAKDFTVTTSVLVQFYVSDYFWPVVIGVPVLAAAVITLIVLKKKKKAER